MANEIERPADPVIPYATQQYERRYFDQTFNVLRIFFVRLMATVNSLFNADSNGGKFLYMPRGNFYSTSDQTAAAADTGYAVTFNQTNYTSGVTLSNNSRINVVDAGTYHFDVTLQLEHNNSSETSVTVWEAKNGIAISYSGHKFDVKGNDDYVIHWGFGVSLAAGDYIEIYWATGDTQLNLHSEAATSPHPGIPSASVEVVLVSNS